jgi:LysR family nitrogen assimilation transcriptional regulator
MPTFLSAHLAVPIFGALRDRFPRLHVRLVDGFSGFVNQWLLEGRLDIAVIYEARRSHAISAEPLADEELFLFASRELGKRAVASRVIPATGGAPLEAISQLDIILPGREHGLRRALQRAGARPDQVRLLEVDSLAAIRALVRTGAGWSVLPRAGLTAEDLAGVVRPLGNPPMRVRLMLAFSANRPITPALRALSAFLKNEVAHLQARQLLSPSHSPPPISRTEAGRARARRDSSG